MNTRDGYSKTTLDENFILKADGGHAEFHWPTVVKVNNVDTYPAQLGQPNYLWGGNAIDKYYTYDPKNFDVNSALYLRWEAASSSDYKRLIPIGWASNTETSTTQFRATYDSNFWYQTDTNTLNTNITGTAGKVDHSISFKNTSGTTVSFNGLSDIDLTGGVYYATTAGSAGTASYANRLNYTGLDSSCFTVAQTSGDFKGKSGWSTYLICNHGNGDTYYNQIIRMPFWGTPQYGRAEGNGSETWYDFITSENIGSQSVNTSTYSNYTFVSSSDANLTFYINFSLSGGEQRRIYNDSDLTYNPSTNYMYGGSFQASNWFRSTGATGWYSQTYGGGIYMADTTYVRTYGTKQFYVNYSGDHAIYTAGGFASARTSGAILKTYYNGTWYDCIYNHGNGNISIDAAGGSLYLSYFRGNTYFGGGTYCINRSGYFNGYCKYTNTVSMYLEEGECDDDGYYYMLRKENCNDTSPDYIDYLENVLADDSGNVKATHFYEHSDIRFKTVLSNIELSSKDIASLPIFNFKWTDSGVLSSGTSALAVLQLLPNIVGGNNRLTLDYGALGTIVGVIACKELVMHKSEIDQLKERISELELKLLNYELRIFNL